MSCHPESSHRRRRGIRASALAATLTFAALVSACGSTSSPAGQAHDAQAAASGPTCNDWSRWSTSKQTSFVRSLVGSTNLALRVAGITGSCVNLAHNGDARTPVVSEVKGIASSWPSRVHVNLAKLPPTRNPDDPHQCFERMNAIANPTNANSPPDCLAMGF